MAEGPSRKRRAADLLARLPQIRDAQDRRRSFELVRLLADGRLDEERTADVAETLIALEDPRCAPALTAIVLDAKATFAARAASVEILSATPADDPPRERSRAWSHDHDPCVRALGVQYLDVPEGALLAAAVSDPEPVVRRVAAESMASLVRTPVLVDALRRALRDEDAVVREVACRVALFDEPLEASWELLRGLSDPSAVVRSAAMDALEWFPRVSVMLALADARGGADADSAETVLRALCARVLAGFADATPPARRRLERWAGPVAWLLAELSEPRRGRRDARADDDAPGDDAPGDDDAPAGGPENASPPAPTVRVDLDQAAVVLDDPDAPPILQREILTRRLWDRAGRRGLDILRAASKSSNWALRQMSARPLSVVGGLDELAALGFDREPVVRRAAFVAALDRDDLGGRRLLEGAREALRDPWARPTAGDHALALVAAHGDSAEIEAVVLDELSRPDDRDGLFLGAIQLARLAGVPRAVPALLAIVNAPVVGSVAPHVAALQALRAFGHPRSRIDLRHLDGVDHLDVQRELGAWGWHGARWG